MSNEIVRVVELTPEIIDAVEYLGSQHVEEIDVGTLDIDWGTVEALLAMDAMIAFVVYSNYGEIVGYCSYLVSPVLFQKGEQAAAQHCLFIRKDRRGGTTAVRLLKHSEKYLRDQTGISSINQVVTTTNNAGTLMERLGYTLAEQVYTKRI